MPGQMPQPYEGDQPYVFIDYAHADRGAVLPIVRALTDEGYRVWWDDGIEPTTDYDEYLADHVYGCDCLVMFVSSSSLGSDWCTQEVRYALDLKKKVLPIYLEKVELTRGLQLRMGGKQALFWYEFESDEAFYKRLFKARRLEPCLTEEGWLGRGVKPRSGRAETGKILAGRPTPVEAGPDAGAKAGSAADTVVKPKAEPYGAPNARPATGVRQGTGTNPRGTVRHLRTVRQGASVSDQLVELNSSSTRGEESGSEFGSDSRGERRKRVAVVSRLDGASLVEKRDKLADYSWAELKELSRMIAAARSDAEGLGIARAYRLLGEDGKLHGDEKPLELRDGTRRSVRVLGFRHDELAELSDGGRAGISFEFADVPARHRMNPTKTNAGGWQGSEMRRWLNDAEGGFLGLLPDDLRVNVAEARKRTNNRGMVTENDIACVTTTEDRLWLLSAYEVYGGVPSWMYSPATYAEEGGQYRLYADEGVKVENYGFCKKRGAGSWWWLRSPYANRSDAFPDVSSDGVWGYWIDADNEGGVSPGFCF